MYTIVNYADTHVARQSIIIFLFVCDQPYSFQSQFLYIFLRTSLRMYVYKHTFFYIHIFFYTRRVYIVYKNEVNRVIIVLEQHQAQAKTHVPMQISSAICMCAECGICTTQIEVLSFVGSRMQFIIVFVVIRALQCITLHPLLSMKSIRTRDFQTLQKLQNYSFGVSSRCTGNCVIYPPSSIIVLIAQVFR